MQLHAKPGSLDTVSERRTEGESPHHQFSLQSMMDLPRQWELDSAIRYVDALPGLIGPSYVALNVRLGWRPSENWEISIIGQDLLDNWHPEFSAGFGVPGQTPEVECSVYGKLVWRF